MTDLDLERERYRKVIADLDNQDDLIANLEAELAATKKALFAMQRERDQLKAQLEAKQVAQ